jgi:hypothetical protein
MDIIPEIHRRLRKMFLLESGTPKATGDGPAMTEVTAGVLIDVVKAVGDFFKEHDDGKVFRGWVDKQQARGWVLADLRGCPFLEAARHSSRGEGHGARRRQRDRQGSRRPGAKGKPGGQGREEARPNAVGRARGHGRRCCGRGGSQASSQRQGQGRGASNGAAAPPGARRRPWLCAETVF